MVTRARAPVPWLVVVVVAAVAGGCEMVAGIKSHNTSTDAGGSTGMGGQAMGTGGTGGQPGGAGGQGGSVGAGSGGSGGFAGTGGAAGQGATGTGGAASGAGGMCVVGRTWPIPNASISGRVPSYDTPIAGVVRDNVTGLVWEQNASTATYALVDAIAYCSALSLGGLSGWRVPTRIELVSVVDYALAMPAIAPAFQGTMSGLYWTSSATPTVQWTVDFARGRVATTTITGDHYVRCVR